MILCYVFIQVHVHNIDYVLGYVLRGGEDCVSKQYDWSSRSGSMGTHFPYPPGSWMIKFSQHIIDYTREVVLRSYLPWYPISV